MYHPEQVYIVPWELCLETDENPLRVVSACMRVRARTYSNRAMTCPPAYAWKVESAVSIWPALVRYPFCLQSK
jgi:hypothetical protein